MKMWTPGTQFFRPGAVAAVVIFVWLLSTGWALKAERTFDPLNRAYSIHLTSDSNGFTAMGWTDSSHDAFSCLIGNTTEGRYCGINISLGDGTSQGEDLSKYASLELTLGYQGPAETLRVFTRQSLPPEALANSSKYQSVDVPLSSGVARYRIPLSAFTLPEWWKKESPNAADYFYPDFSNILLTGFDIQSPISYGLHQFEVLNFQFKQRWLSTAVAPYWALGSALYFVFSWLIYRQLRLAVQLRQRHLEAVGLRHQVRLLDQESARLRHLSMYDPLTQLFNRRAAEDMIENFRENGGLAGTAVILLDIDHFKPINDTHGHSTGDQVLQELSRRILGQLRDGDAAVRWGGEEILVVCTDVKGQDQAMRIAEKLRLTIADERFASGSLAVTASFGVVVCQPDENFDSALERADNALYRAKRSGRNRCIGV